MLLRKNTLLLKKKISSVNHNDTKLYSPYKFNLLNSKKETFKLNLNNRGESNQPYPTILFTVVLLILWTFTLQYSLQDQLLTVAVNQFLFSFIFRNQLHMKTDPFFS